MQAFNKRLLFFAVAAFIILFYPLVASANEVTINSGLVDAPDVQITVPTDTAKSYGYTNEQVMQLQQQQKEADLAQKAAECNPTGMFDGILAGVINSISGIFENLQYSNKLEPLDSLIFNHGKDAKKLDYEPFEEAWWPSINKWYAGLSAAVGPLILIAILVTAVRFMGAAVNPVAKEEAWNSVWRWLLSVFIIASAPILFWVLFRLNNSLVTSIYAVARGVADTGKLQNLQPGSNFIKYMCVGSGLGQAIIRLVFDGIGFYINLLFSVRQFVLLILYIYTPIMAWLWAINRNVVAPQIWLGEVLSNAFMQAAYALVFLIFLTFVDFNTEKWYLPLIWVVNLIPMAEMVRNMLNGFFGRFMGFDERSGIAQVMGLAGLGGISGLGNVAKATFSSSGGSGFKESLAGEGGGSGGDSNRGPAGSAFGSQGRFITPPTSLGQSAGGALGSGSAPGAVVSGLTIPGVAGFSGPGGGTDPVITGYGMTPGGVMAPQHAVERAFAGGGASSGGEAVSRPAAGAAALRGEGLMRALNTAQVAGGIAGKALGVAGRIAFAGIPGGMKTGEQAFGTVGHAAGRFGGMAASMYYQAKEVQAQKPGMGFVEALQEVTGGSSKVRGVGKAIEMTAIHTFSPGLTNVAVQRFVPQQTSINGHRWRH